MLYNKEQIKEVIPHREPFLLVDGILEYVERESVTAVKYVTGDEDFFRGHFPGNPVLPGVLIVEAMAQTGAVVVLSMEKFRGKTGYFAGIDKVRFKRKVRPGEQLALSVTIERVLQNIGTGAATATVDGKAAARARLTFAVE